MTQLSVFARSSITAILLMNLFTPIAHAMSQSTESSEVRLAKDSFLYNMNHLDDLISIVVTPSELPEIYSVQLAWPELESDLSFHIDLGSASRDVAANKQALTVLVNHDQLLNCDFELRSSDGKILKRFSKSTQIPKDFVVSLNNSDISHLKTLNVSRLFLNPHVRLITGASDIEINATTIITNDGKIETFADGLQASSDETSDKARSGGTITIHAERAIGNLKVILRGEIGKNGAPGASWSGARANDGAAPGHGHCYSVTGGGRHGDTPQTRCSHGNPGSSGRPGAKGNQGGKSGNGGDTGNLMLFVGDSSRFHLEVVFEPGSPGQPGLGGPGQPGGIAPGRSDDLDGEPGVNGPQGPNGDAGPVGNSGIKGKSCYFYADQAAEECTT